MAGPGGGPPRKSHTKSKKGCKTCKRRHIRCDEAFPQCRNCTKHNCRCDYQDLVVADEGFSPGPSGQMLPSPHPEDEIDHWLRTGTFPFPELCLQNPNQFAGLGRTDLRLIHHLCNAYRALHGLGMLWCIPWINQLPVFFNISGQSHPCVLSALLAFSAQRLALGTNAQEMIAVADKYREHALQTTQKALGSFSQENADSILATSIILSWQVDEELASWNSLMQGIQTVINHMGDWKFSSPIASFAETHVLARPSTVSGRDHTLEHAIASIQKTCDMLGSDGLLADWVAKLWQSVCQIHTSSQAMPPEQIFQQLGFLRSQVLWAPLECLWKHGLSARSLTALAQAYALACAVDATLPELNGASLGAMAHSTIDSIDQHVRYSTPASVSSKLEPMMQYPRHILQRFHHRAGSTEPTFSLTSAPAVSSQSPHSLGNLDLHSGSGTPPYPPSMHYLESQGQGEISMPSSPFLHSVNRSVADPTQQSGYFGTGQRSVSIYSDSGSLNVPSIDSPQFSPSFLPQAEPAGYMSYTNGNAEVPLGFASGSTSLTRPTDKGKSKIPCQ